VSDLERSLRELRVEWPATPDLAAAVRARIGAEGARAPAPARRAPLRRRLAWAPAHPALAAALAALLALAGAMAVPPARSAILEALGLKGAKVERREPTATATPRALSAPLGKGLDLGRPVTLAQARRAAGFRIVVPGAGLGAPDAVFFDSAPRKAGRVSFLYKARAGLPRAAETGAGLLVTEFEAVVDPVIEKAAGVGTKIERFKVDGAPAIRLSGRPHGFAFMVPQTGEVNFEEQRLAGDTLLVEHDNLLIRIEGRIPRDRAVEIARSMLGG
jgi:hypothetical protein